MQVIKFRLNIGRYYRFYVLIITLLLFFFVTRAQAQPFPQATFKQVGEGTMSWMFLDIYHASLLTQSGYYKDKTYPVALTITYLKNITKNRLIKVTKAQWLLQGYTKEQISPWLVTLEEIWPDISDGDTLSFFVDKFRKGTFYHNKMLLKKIDSIKLSDAFIAIWLSEKTSEPVLRRQLLGRSIKI